MSTPPVWYLPAIETKIFKSGHLFPYSIHAVEYAFDGRNFLKFVGFV